MLSAAVPDQLSVANPFHIIMLLALRRFSIIFYPCCKEYWLVLLQASLHAICADLCTSDAYAGF